jgi:hypothetical protein
MGTSTSACRGGCSGTPTSTTSTRSTRASPEDSIDESSSSSSSRFGLALCWDKLIEEESHLMCVSTCCVLVARS